MSKKSPSSNKHHVGGDTIVTKDILHEFGIILRADIKKDTADIVTDIVTDAINELAGVTSNNFTRLEKRMDVMEDRFDKVDEKFDKIDEKFQEIDLRFDQIDEKFDEIDDRFDDVDLKFDGVTQRIQGLWNVLDNRLPQYATKIEHEQLKGRVDLLEAV